MDLGMMLSWAGKQDSGFSPPGHFNPGRQTDRQGRQTGLQADRRARFGPRQTNDVDRMTACVAEAIVHLRLLCQDHPVTVKCIGFDKIALVNQHLLCPIPMHQILEIQRLQKFLQVIHWPFCLFRPPRWCAPAQKPFEHTHDLATC